MRAFNPGPDGGRAEGGLVLDQPDVTRARSFRRVFRRKFHTLAFSQQLEDSSAHCAAVKKMLDAAFIADKPEPLVDQETSNSPVRHTVSSDARVAWENSQALPWI